MAERLSSNRPVLAHDSDELATVLLPVSHDASSELPIVHESSEPLVQEEIIAPTEESSRNLIPNPDLTLVMVDQSKDARDFARDAADARLTNELQEGNRLQKFVKGVWKGNFAKDYYRQKYIREAQSQIESSQDVLVHEASDSTQRTNAQIATIERFQHEYDEMINNAAGENRNQLANDSELATGLKGIIRQYAEGTLDDVALREEQTRVIEAYREAHPGELAGEGLVRTDNLLDIAQAVKGAIENGESIDNVIAGMKIITGEARTGARTEAHYSKADKAVEWLSKRKITSFLPEAAIATATSVASGVLRLGSSKVVNAAAMTLAPGVGSAIMAGIRENKHVKDERQQHAREMAMGKEFNPDDKRRSEMENSRYETVAAVDLIDGLRENHASILLDPSERASGETKDDALQAALDALAAVEVRNFIADSEKMDLITFSDVANVNEERMQLALARAELKVLLRSELDDTTRARLGLEPSHTIEDILEGRSSEYLDTLAEDLSDKDKAFRKLRTRRVAFAAGAGFAAGLTLGLASQEMVASLDASRTGLVEQLWDADNHSIDGVNHQTMLNGLVNGEHTSSHVAPSSEFTSNHIGDKGTLKLSNDHTLVENPDGTLKFVDLNGNTTVDHLAIDDKGTLSPESIKLLEAKGMTVEDTHVTIDHVSQEQRSVSFHDYMKHHRDDTTHVKRDLWYDNDTAAPNKNELGLQWTDSGTTDAGTVQLNISSMSGDGSSHGSESVNWATQAKEGKLQLAISASSGEQAHPFMVDINPDGTINIPEDSPASQFFSQEDGQTVFNGRYAEVVQLGKVDDRGIQHIRPLSTLVGTGEASHQNFNDTVTVHKHELRPGYKITTAGYENTASFTEMAPTIPIASRRSMESARRSSTPEAIERNNDGDDLQPYYYNGEAQYMSVEAVQAAREVTSPRILERPEQRLNPREELAWYKELARKKRGAEYVEEIDSLIAASPELSSIDNNLKAIVKIPVNAAGRVESESIYDTLSQAYALQDKSALSQSMLLLHVNWMDDLVNDPEKGPMIAKTRAEIARARADFPDLKIAIIETEFKRAEVSQGVIGFVSSRLNDAALFAINNAMERGDIEDDHDVLLIRNDADPKGVSSHYLRRYIDTFGQNDETDIFTGTTTFDNTKAADLPGMVFAANFMQSLNLVSAVREGQVHTGGANFGVRASTFAAVGGIGFGDSGSGAGSDDVIIGRRIMAARAGKISSDYESAAAGTAAFYQGWKQQQQSSSSVSSGQTSEEARRPKMRVGMRVTGARIDTDSDREEELYRKGVPIVNTWNHEFGFNDNGYRERDAGLKGVMTESLETDPDGVIERIRNDIEGSLNSMGASRAVMDTALFFAFGGTSNYRLRRQGDRRNGKFVLQVTDSGKQYLVNHLTRDSKGRADAYGARKLRQLYGEAAPGLRQPVGPRSMIRV